MNDRLETADGQSRSADDVRQGEIVLRSRRRRVIFIGGIVAALLIGLVLELLIY